ncbi:hypothetical protein [Limnobacter sp.]|uniref:hypothetical protein n=1 Tax=Limnobacter sp. TaxID=2003368 RepID=UPI00391DDD8D
MKAVRVSYIITEAENGYIEHHATRARKFAGDDFNNSQLIRVGIHLLSNLTDGELVKAFKNIVKLPKGRPRSR